MCRRIFADQLTPVLAYRRLVRKDERLAPSFLLESVVGGDRVGQYSYMGARPAVRVIARGRRVRVDRGGVVGEAYRSEDPLGEVGAITAGWEVARVDGLAEFAGGWVGLAGYDTVRYLEGEKLGEGPADDRGLPDLDMGLYRRVVAFDHVQKTVVVMTNVVLDEHAGVRDAYEAGVRELDDLVEQIETPREARAAGQCELAVGAVDLEGAGVELGESNMGKGGYQRAVEACKRYILAGDVFQVVPSQRFEMRTAVDPFDVYRALRVVNPSPYMFYLQIDGGVLVGSSPEILCRVKDGEVISRPLAGTRRRGADQREDRALEAELLSDPKERAEHVMLVDLGRNDVGRVSEVGSVELAEVMAIERYSHVMHISSEVRGRLRAGCDCWDALRFSLPVGTVSGAPKVRAMQVIDKLEPTRRGPYAGAVGLVDLVGHMDMAIALRTMVITPSCGAHDASDAASVQTTMAQTPQARGEHSPRWIVHLQAGAGIVADSDPDSEDAETRSKAAALAKAVRLAEHAFSS